jgi:CRISPR-associated protein Csm1
MEVGDCKGSSLMVSDVHEYNSVLLAALLHDIGKMLHRTPGSYGTSHEKVSGRFIAETREKLENPELYDLPLVKFLVEGHHGLKKEVMARVEAQALGGNERRLWKLISIVRRADSYSCAERDQKQESRPMGEMRKASLDSIFSRLKLGAEDGAKGPPRRYHLTPLSPIDAFPEDIDLLEDKEIEGLIDNFNQHIPDFTGFKDFGSVLHVWTDLLERYTWAVPSDTRYQTSDVSLFDHLRSTAAIAACLYHRHMTDEEGRNLDRINEFVLIGGDFSGIQRYIFEITSAGSGGASKRLRARSFFISMFSEMSSHKILHALGLPLLCNLFSAGGKFLLLAPNLERSDDVEGVQETLTRIKREIEEEIHSNFFGQFSFLMSWFPIRGFKAEFQVRASKAGPKSFFETADRMFHQLERERSRKLRTALISKHNLKWAPEAFKATDVYNKYAGAGDCKYCGKGPGNHEDK